MAAGDVMSFGAAERSCLSDLDSAGQEFWEFGVRDGAWFRRIWSGNYFEGLS